MMKRLNWAALCDAEKSAALARPEGAQDAAITNSTQRIVQTVRERGDAAIAAYTAQFDGVMLDRLAVDEAEWQSAVSTIDASAKQAIQTAYQNIRAFHAGQGYQAITAETMPGLYCERRTVPLQSVGLYVPGGSAPLISTCLMLGIPAQLAACPARILCTPCGPDGRVNAHILYAAQLCGITQVFKVGGAQAIAAMAYGTASILKVDKVFGPGNAYVTMAKKIVAADPDGAAMDMPAGPSEVLVIANDSTPPAFAAADLLSQAEHDPMSQVMLLCTSDAVCDAVLAALKAQLCTLPRKAIAEQALRNGCAIVVQNLSEALAISNRYAPEHLVLCFEDAADYLGMVTHAGSVFVGPYSCEAAGDYASGTNHVLPTYGYARAYSGLSVEAFQKTITFQTISKGAARALGPTVEALARLEGLEAHARAMAIRG